MKKIKIEEMSMEERNEVCELLATWLEPYTQEVIVRVMERREEIINNEFAMMLLKQLKEREEKEQERESEPTDGGASLDPGGTRGKEG